MLRFRYGQIRLRQKTGLKVEQRILRLGSFAQIGEEGFLKLKPGDPRDLMEYAVQPRASLFSNASSLGLGVKTKERLLFGIDPMRGAFLESLQDDSVFSGGRFEIEAASYAVMILSIFSCVWLLFILSTFISANKNLANRGSPHEWHFSKKSLKGRFLDLSVN